MTSVDPKYMRYIQLTFLIIPLLAATGTRAAFVLFDKGKVAYARILLFSMYVAYVGYLLILYKTLDVIFIVFLAIAILIHFKIWKGLFKKTTVHS